MKISTAQFISIVDATPLVSIDLIIINPKNEVLLGRRLNKPAQGYWFVPGGRIQKNEKIAQAFGRICEKELGQQLHFNQAILLGAYDHIYEDNFSGLNDINTHYVVLGYRIDLPSPQEFIFDEQHDLFQWWPVEKLLNNSMVHQNTKNYFMKI